MEKQNKNLTLFISIVFFLFLSSCSSSSVSSSGQKAELFYRHGTEKLSQKDYTEALGYLLEAYKLNPNDTHINNNLAMAYYFKDRADLTLVHLKKSLDLAPSNSDARNNLASVYMQEGKIDLAEKEYKLILNDLLYRQQHYVYYNLALIELKKKNETKALEYLELSKKQNMNFCASYLLSGSIKETKGELRKALDDFVEGTKGTCFSNPAPHYAQAQIYIKLKSYVRAREKFQEILDRFPQSIEAVQVEEELKNLTLLQAGQKRETLNETKTDATFVTPHF